jgi:hypothetical protein
MLLWVWQNGVSILKKAVPSRSRKFFNVWDFVFSFDLAGPARFFEQTVGMPSFPAVVPCLSPFVGDCILYDAFVLRPTYFHLQCVLGRSALLGLGICSLISWYAHMGWDP